MNSVLPTMAIMGGQESTLSSDAARNRLRKDPKIRYHLMKAELHGAFGFFEDTLQGDTIKVSLPRTNSPKCSSA